MSVTPLPADQRLQVASASLWAHPSGHVVVDQIPGALQTEDTAREMFDAARTLVPAGEVMALLVLANQSRTDRSARAAFAELGMSHGAAVALVVRSRVARMTGNFFLRINKPAFPMQLFDTPEDADRWLATHVGQPRPD